MSSPSKAWSPRQLADVIEMSKDFVLSEIKAGEISASKFGNRYRISADEVIRYLEHKRFPVATIRRAPAHHDLA